jgi:hypothetical protein
VLEENVHVPYMKLQRKIFFFESGSTEGLELQVSTHGVEVVSK